MIKINQDYDPETGKKVTYKMIKKDAIDANGFVDVKRYIPADFDLMYLKFKNHRPSFGWSNGKKWYGAEIGRCHEVLFWKRKEPKED